MKTAIIIPARYGSTRFPGKPLAMIAGQTMLSRVVDIARAVSVDIVAVATEDQRIADHADTLGVQCVMTSDKCETGSDRVLEAIDALDADIDFVIGLQGDAPFTPPAALNAMIDQVKENPKIDVITPVVNLRWAELDALREQKKTTPFSGTTAILNAQGRALWFSKSILPAIRKEEVLRAQGDYSPVYQHMGLYGYRVDVLRRFAGLAPAVYEQLEGLEQLRLIENNIDIHTVTIDLADGLAQSGIDSPEDVTRAEKRLGMQQGDS